MLFTLEKAKILLSGKLIDCMVFNTVFQLYHSGQCTYPCFPGVLLTSTPHSILSKPLAAFQHNHCRNNELSSFLGKSIC